jgi:hypothetical protein
VVEHQRRDVGLRDVALEVREIQRHHLVADQLVDHRVGEEHVLGAAVEPAQQS